MFPPQRCSLLLLIQPPSVVACLWVSAFSFVLPESTHCWTSKTILFPRLICLHCKVLPKQFCNWDCSPVHFTLLLLSTIKSSVHTSNPLPLAHIFARALTLPPPCLTHGVLWIMGCSFFLQTSSIIKSESKQRWRLFLGGKVLPVLEFAPCAFTLLGQWHTYFLESVFMCLNVVVGVFLTMEIIILSCTLDVSWGLSDNEFLLFKDSVYLATPKVSAISDWFVGFFRRAKWKINTWNQLQIFNLFNLLWNDEEKKGLALKFSVKCPITFEPLKMGTI